MKTINKLLVIVTALCLSACATTDNVKLTTRTQPIGVPLIYSPSPPKIDRPDLPHLKLTPDDTKVDGKVVQAYAASVQALLGYSEQLESVISNYKDINDSYAQVRAKLVADWKASTGVDITVQDPTQKTVPAPTSSVPPVSDLVHK